MCCYLYWYYILIRWWVTNELCFVKILRYEGLKLHYNAVKVGTRNNNAGPSTAQLTWTWSSRLVFSISCHLFIEWLSECFIFCFVCAIYFDSNFFCRSYIWKRQYWKCKNLANVTNASIRPSIKRPRGYQVHLWTFKKKRTWLACHSSISISTMRQLTCITIFKKIGRKSKRIIILVYQLYFKIW